MPKKPVSWNKEWKKNSDTFPKVETQSVDNPGGSGGQGLTMKDVAYWMKGINATLAQLMKKAGGQDRSIKSDKSERSEPPDITTVRCYSCGQLGHYQNSCTKKVSLPISTVMEVEEENPGNVGGLS